MGLRLAALVCFILAAVGLPSLAGVGLVPAGLACWVASSFA
jgi:hypothetical protein